MIATYNKISIVTFLLFCFSVRISMAQKAEIRIVPTGEYVIRCCITNDSGKSLKYPAQFLFLDNTIFYELMTSSQAWRQGTLGSDGDISGEIPHETLQRSSSRVFLAREKDLYLRVCFPNDYLRCYWRIGKFASNEVAIGVDCGEMKTPIFKDEEKKAKLMLGMLLGADAAKDVSLWCHPCKSNGVIAGSLSTKASIISSSQSIGYSSEIPLASIIPTDILTISNGVWHCRIPWSEIWDQIPEADRKKLEAAGAVDLRWECGYLVSDPLPLWVGPVDESEMPEEKTR